MSSLTIKELITSWGFSVDDKALKGLDDKLVKLQSSVKYVGGLAVGAAASLFGMAKLTANAGDQVAKAASKLGVGVEALQEYRHAASLAGVANTVLDKSLQKLVVGVGEAKKGSGFAKDALAELSRAAGRDLVMSAKPAEELLLDVADAFVALKSDSDRTRLAVKLFGEEGGSMVNLLKGGSAALREQRQEARALGLVMSAQATKASEDFNDSLTRATGALTGLRNTVGVRLLPVIQRLVKRFTSFVVANRQWLALKIERAIKVMSDYVERATTVFIRIARQINFVVEGLGGWERVARAVGIAMIALMGLRIVSFLGQLIMSLGKAVLAFRLLGNAGLLAQAKLAAIPLAIGAAFIGLLLIIEDVVAYFQGRRSVTGALIGNFEAVSNKLDEWVGRMLTKVKAFGENIGRMIADGLANLGEADWKKIGDLLLKALKLALDVGTIPFQIGMAIADGIIEGLVKQLRQRFPALAGMLLLDDEGGANPNTAMINPQPGADGSKPGYMSRIGHAFLNQGQGESLLGIGMDAIADFTKWSMSDEARKISLPMVNPSDISNNVYGNGSVNVQAPITVNVPAGTPPEAVAGAARAGVKDSLDSIMRETGRAVKPAISY